MLHVGQLLSWFFAFRFGKVFLNDVFSPFDLTSALFLADRFFSPLPF